MQVSAKELDKLTTWFHEIKRDLPWRINPTPYGVWVSEVMLQQTQVATVIPYYLRWMQRFPTIRDLAKASEDEVVKEWEGLGYYSRARNLHRGAQHVVAHFGGQLPSSAEQLQKIKGLGPYTVGAILSFAFHCKAAAVDGNVMRVLTRYFQIYEDIAKPKTLKMVQQLAYGLLPEEQPWVVNEALIELGATVCAKVPKCRLCPLQANCRGYSAGIARELPIKSRGKAIEQLVRHVAVIICEGHVLVRRCLEREIMSGLHEFPFIEKPVDLDIEEAFQLFHLWHASIRYHQKLREERHSFTHHRAVLHPAIYFASEQFKMDGYKWVSFEALASLAFSSGHRRILGQLDLVVSVEFS